MPLLRFSSTTDQEKRGISKKNDNKKICFYFCVYVCMYAVYVWVSGEAIKGMAFTGVKALGGCELPEMGAGN